MEQVDLVHQEFENMEFDDLIKNVKSTLVKAAAEGKKKGIAVGIKQASEIVGKKVDEFKESLLTELNNALNENGESVDEDSSQKEN